MLISAACGLAAACSVNDKSTVNTTPSNTKAFENEVIYHVFQRSFYDSNKDMHGDLKGLEQKLDYLQELGITSILLLPLYESDYHHNYFANDFKTIDPEYGTLEDYLSLVKEVHRRGMKIYMDMEPQYVAENHAWFKDSLGNPFSKYSDYVLYNDEANQDPESAIFFLKKIDSHTGDSYKVTTVNLADKKVKTYLHDLFKFWVDPNQDGDFSDGVDGFRIDHMMDDLDAKGQLTNLFSDLWSPIFEDVKSINPELTIIAEQAYWTDYGEDWLTRGNVDAVFGFPIMEASAKFNKINIADAIMTTEKKHPDNKHNILFIENHDTPRFAHHAGSDPKKLRIGAVLNTLLPGVPSIYYGQEIGMKGNKGSFDMSDGNDIPIREAFEWHAGTNPEGMTLWYKDSGPWWDISSLKAHDGISVEEQMVDPQSLWNFYRELLNIRKQNKAFTKGDINMVNLENPTVLSFTRSFNNESFLVSINLSNKASNVSFKLDDMPFVSQVKLKDLQSGSSNTVSITNNSLSFTVEPFGIYLSKLK